MDRAAMLEMMAEWSVVLRQLTCDRACWECPSARVVSCSLINCDPRVRKMVLEGARPGGK